MLREARRSDTPKKSSARAPKGQDAWAKTIAQAVVRRFRHAAKTVPAYKEFLRENKVDAELVRTMRDVSRIPRMGKREYLRAYPWKELCSADALADEALVLTATSGSTGIPFYIPRADEIHENSVIFHDLFLKRSGLKAHKPTLVVVCFGMGVWIGGLITYEAFRRISERGNPLTLITPGVNKKEIFEALERVAPAYEQLVLCGYPPFVKDLIDDGPAQGIDWKRWDMRIVCAAEAFSEHFREYLMERTGMKDPYRSVMNIYGSAELGTMASETPLSILVRRHAVANPDLYKRLFREANRLPTLAQFVPSAVAFEAAEDGAVLATGGSVLPLVRYDIGDQGGVLGFSDIERAYAEAGLDLRAEAERAGIADTVSELPFVYLYERADLSTKLYGAIIYPEHVKAGLQALELEPYLTGRFTLATEHDAEHNEYLEVNVELKRNVAAGDAPETLIVERITESLAKHSDEYRYLLGTIPAKISPRIVFWPHEDPKYFRPGIKQKWVIRGKE